MGTTSIVTVQICVTREKYLVLAGVLPGVPGLIARRADRPREVTRRPAAAVAGKMVETETLARDQFFATRTWHSQCTKFKKSSRTNIKLDKKYGRMAGKMVETEAPLARDTPYQFFAARTWHSQCTKFKKSRRTNIKLDKKHGRENGGNRSPPRQRRPLPVFRRQDLAQSMHKI